MSEGQDSRRAWRDDDDDDYVADDEGDEPPMFGCACEDPLCVDTVCGGCLALLREQHLQQTAAEFAAALADAGREVPAWVLAIAESAPEATTMVRAKFSCVKNEAGSIELQAVHAGSPENEQFFSATPNGQVSMQVVNPPAAADFVVGKQYYVDFTEVDAAEDAPAQP